MYNDNTETTKVAVSDLGIQDLIIAIGVYSKHSKFVLRYDDYGKLCYGLTSEPSNPRSWLESSLKVNDDYCENLIESISGLNVQKIEDIYYRSTAGEYSTEDNKLNHSLLKLWLLINVGEHIVLPVIFNEARAETQVYPAVKSKKR